MACMGRFCWAYLRGQPAVHRRQGTGQRGTYVDSKVAFCDDLLEDRVVGADSRFLVDQWSVPEAAVCSGPIYKWTLKDAPFTM